MNDAAAGLAGWSRRRGLTTFFGLSRRRQDLKRTQVTRAGCAREKYFSSISLAQQCAEQHASIATRHASC